LIKGKVEHLCHIEIIIGRIGFKKQKRMKSQYLKEPRCIYYSLVIALFSLIGAFIGFIFLGERSNLFLFAVVGFLGGLIGSFMGFAFIWIICKQVA